MKEYIAFFEKYSVEQFQANKENTLSQEFIWIFEKKNIEEILRNTIHYFGVVDVQCCSRIHHIPRLSIISSDQKLL